MQEVTIIMPVFNPRPEYFAAAINSVLEQSDQRWKMLIVAESHIALPCSDPRIVVIRNKGRRLGGAINTGVQVATTDFVAFLHDDDLIAPYAIEVLRRHDADIIHSSRRLIDDNGAYLGPILRSKKVSEAVLRRQGIKHLICMRKERILEVGGVNESISEHGCDDWDLPWRMWEAGCKFKNIRDCLYLYRDHRKNTRLTTHVPLDRQIEIIRYILESHGVHKDEVETEISERMLYLRQALFISSADKTSKLSDPSFNPQEGFREN